MLVECVPNFSEGRDLAVVARLAASVSPATLLGCTSDFDHNRTVITLAGTAAEVEAATLRLAEAAVRQIDLTRHKGVHPRTGALDVVPFVPVAGLDLRDCAEIARRVAERLWAELRLPSFYYEAAFRLDAFRPEERPLEARSLEAARRAAHGGATPDTGAGRHPTAGAVMIGARKFLVAWNVNLRSTDLALAKRIARAIRFSSGGFPGVKALGLALESRGQVQVSINSTDFDATPLPAVFEAVRRRAAEEGVAVAGSELIGFIPARALAMAAGHDLRWENFHAGLVLENALQLKQCS